MRLIHYGAKRFFPSRIQPVKNLQMTKPTGGLWTSPIDSKFGWFDWCKQESFYEDRLENHFIVSLKSSCKLLTINTYKDLESIPFQKNEKLLRLTCPDFEKIADIYDAMYLTYQGLKETHLSYPYNLYGWDCESVLVFNADCLVFA